MFSKLSSKSKSVCTGCKRAHDISLFSKSAREKEPLVTKYRGLEGCLWICPHEIWRGSEVRELAIWNSGKMYRKSCQCLVNVGITGKTSILESYPLLLVPSRVSVDQEDMHLRSDNDDFLDSLFRDAPDLIISRVSPNYDLLGIHIWSNCGVCQTDVSLRMSILGHRSQDKCLLLRCPAIWRPQKAFSNDSPEMDRAIDDAQRFWRDETKVGIEYSNKPSTL